MRKQMNCIHGAFAGVLAAAMVLGSWCAEDVQAQAAAKPKSISVVPSNKVLGSSKTLYAGGTADLKTTMLKTKVKPAKASQKVKYVSSNKKVATVNSKGKVTAKKAGKVTITVASAKNKKVKKRVKLQVKKYVYPKSLKAELPVESLNNGESCQMKAVLAPSNTTIKKLTYRTSDASLATVSSSGVVTANNKERTGTVKITVSSAAKTKSKEVLTGTVEIKIEKPVSMQFSPKEKTVYLSGTSSTVTSSLVLEKKNMDDSEAITYASSNTDVATVDAAGTVVAKRMGKAVVTAVSESGIKAQCTVYVKRSDLAIHDPSVYRDPISGNYFTLGSHVTAATSTDLIGWDWTANSSAGYTSDNHLFTKRVYEEFAEPYAFTVPEGEKGETAWAPSIIYNTAMKKYCMYISITNGSKKCCIAMATSDKPEGPYSYQDMIVCSGITPEDIDKTNVARALGMTEEEARESKYATLDYYSPDCIDATVFYDHDGNLWMVYGSFTTFGGIRLLKLDPATGLRGENYEDSGDGGAGKAGTEVLDTRDSYYGLKIALNQGEGPFIQEMKDERSSTGYYYYFWYSTEGLESYAGYNMRIFRSENVEGPYIDSAGNEALSGTSKTRIGTRVMANYKFSFMDTAFTSCGGNSATADENGKSFLHFHQKYANGTEAFTIRTHQTFQNEDGWLVTAPFEYNGETIEDSYDKTEVVGDYEFIYHDITVQKSGTAKYKYTESEKLTLNADGTVTGAYTGKWSMNGHYITIEINEGTYKGVVLKQFEQTDDREEVMVFTAVGNDNRSIWGSKMHRDR